jgi:2',3'-cyclic-nucleotide 2'-phosphodiesterase (5'-nucleotidase family)
MSKSNLPVYLPRPREASGTYLRVLSINDVYEIQNYPYVETVIQSLKQGAEDAVVVASLSGDFLSPCLLTSLDGGKAMMEVLNLVGIDYICFGNHEFDVNLDSLKERLRNYQGKCLNSNISNLSIVNAAGNSLLKYDILEVGNHKVAFAGFCTDNTRIFRPGTNLIIEPIFDSLQYIWSECKNQAHVLIPLTHQTIAEDRNLAVRIQKDAQLKGKIPAILGGHEHEIYIEEIAEIDIVKAGANAKNVVVVDIWWTRNDRIHTAIHMLPGSHFNPDPNVQVFVQKTQRFLDSLMDVELFNIKETMSSKRTRFQPEKVASTLCSYIKKTLQDVDIVLLQGGCIRGSRNYQQDTSFTYGDLLAELPFDTSIACIQLPGKVLQDAIAQTRSTPAQETPNYLHADFDTIIADYPSLEIIKINNSPFDPQRMYQVGIYQFLLTGLDQIKPLLEYIDAHNINPDPDQCIPAKNLIVEACMKDAWRTLVNFDQWDSNRDGQISQAELIQGIKRAFEFLDQNKDGLISPEELQATLAKRTDNPNKSLINMMFESLDVDKNGLVSMDELASLAM